MKSFLGRATLFVVLGACGGSASSAPSSHTAPSEGTSLGAVPADAAHAEQADAQALPPVFADDIVDGDRQATVTMVVYSDLQCPFCSRHANTLAALRERYTPQQLRIVHKSRPLSFHQWADDAARLGRAVFTEKGVRAYLALSEELYGRSRELTEAAERGDAEFARVAVAMASKSGVPSERLEEALRSTAVAQRVAQDGKEADELDVTGTPGSFINGHRLSGARPLEHFVELIDRELSELAAPELASVAKLDLYRLRSNQNMQLEREALRVEAAERAERERVEASAIWKVPVGKSPTKGPANAPVTLIEFSDFQCPYCKRGDEVVARLEAAYPGKIRRVYKHMPLEFHPRAEPAAEFAHSVYATKGANAFWKVHDALFQSLPKLESADFERIIRAHKLDLGAARAAVKDKRYEQEILADRDLGRRVGARGTPTYFMNGRRIAGARPFEVFDAMMQEELSKSEALLARGVAPAKLYESIVRDGREEVGE